MKKIVNAFIIKLFIISAVLFIVEIIFFNKKPEYYNLFYVLLLPVFFTMTSISFYFQIKSLSKKPAKFFQTTMAFTGIRIIAYLIFLITYVLLTKSNKIALFAIIFFVTYILYTVLELISILKVLNILKRETKQPDNKENKPVKNN